MALKGDLSNLNLGDLFQTLNQNQQTGTLKIWSRHQTREIYFTPNGVTLLTTGGRTGHRLGERFLNAGRLSVSDLESCLRVAEKRHKPLGSILVERNLVSGTDIERALAEQIEDEIYSLFTWTEGSFEFIQGERELEEGIGEMFTPSFFDVGAVLLEAARRIDEWGEIHRRIADLHEVFVRSNLAEYITQRLDEEQGLVFQAIDGRSDVRTIADTCERPIFETAKIIHGFLEAGYVREANTDELLEGTKDLERIGRKDRVKTILRLIIHRRQVSDPRILRRIADAFVEMEDFDAAADIFAEAAHFLHEAGRRDEAIDLLQSATKTAKGHLSSRLLLLRLIRQESQPDPKSHFLLVVEILEILNEAKRKEDAAPFCEDLAELAPGDKETVARAANATLLAGRTDIAVELLERAAGEAAAETRLQDAVEFYREILRIAPENKRIAGNLKELQTTASARRRRKLIIGAVVVLALIAAWFTWDRIESHRRSQELLAELQQLDRDGKDSAAMVVAKLIQAEHPGTVAADEAAATLERLEKEARHRKDIEKAAKAEEAHQLMLEAGSLINSGDIDAAIQRYGVVLDGPMAKEHIATVRSRLKSMLVDANVAMQELMVFLRDLPTPMERLETVEVETSIERLENLLSHLQPRQIARLQETFQNGTFAKILDKKFKAPDDAWIEKVTEVTARGQVTLQDLQQTLARHRERDELDEVYRAARAAEEHGNFESALTLYEHVAERRSGEGASLFAEKAAHLRSLVMGLKRLERAKAERNFEEAVEVLELLIAAYPEFDLSTKVSLPFLLRSVPTDAEVLSAGEVLGHTPLALEYRPHEEALLELRRPGFGAAKYALRGRDQGEATVVLQPVPKASHKSAGAIEAEPTHSASFIHLADRSGNVSAYDPRTGERAWTQRVVKSIGGLKGAPIVRGQNLYVMSFEGDLHRGTTRGEHFEIVQRLGNGLLGPVSGGGKLFVGRANELLAIDLDDPQRVNRTELPTALLEIHTSGDGLYLSLQDGRILRIDPVTSTESWRRPGTGVVSFVLEHEDLALCFRSDGRVVAREIASGRERWRVTLPTAPLRQPLANGARLVVPIGKEIAVLGLADGRQLERWSCRVPSATPALRGDELLLPADEELAVYDLETGRVRWLFHAEGKILAPPLVIGRLALITTDRGQVTFLEMP